MVNEYVPHTIDDHLEHTGVDAITATSRALKVA
jgi:hypothetical protein